MNIWFECKITYFSTDENGKENKVTENYLFDAVSFTDAEARLTEEMAKIQSSNFNVGAIKKSNIESVHAFEAGQFWHRCKVEIVDLNEKTNKEKKTSMFHLILADTVMEATDRIQLDMDEVQVPYNILEVKLSNILDVFPYFADGKAIHPHLKELYGKEREMVEDFEDIVDGKSAADRTIKESEESKDVMIH